MIPDIDFMRNAFRKFNKEMFGGNLLIPVFTLTKARTFYGKCVYLRKGNKVSRLEIRMSVMFDQTAEKWEDVMIHEMIHLYLALKPDCRETAHGPTFRKIMNGINHQYGRHLSISHREVDPGDRESLDSETLSGGKIRRYYVCLGIAPDGRPVAYRAAASRIFKVWDISTFFPNIKEWIWIGSLDGQFEKIPKSLQPKFYYLPEEEEWKGILSRAFALEKKGPTIFLGLNETLRGWLYAHCPNLL